MTTHKTVHDYIPLARSMTAEAFAQRYGHPFLFGREVLEEEFRFSTLVTSEPSGSVIMQRPKVSDRVRPLPTRDTASAVTASGVTASSGAVPGGTDTLRIRHWVIAVKKPPAAPGQDRIFLGRSETNDLCVPHKTVSKLHAYFVRDPSSSGKWQMLDAGSANGTKHNGMRIPARAKVTLVDGDTICFGRCLFQWMSARSLHDRLLNMPLE